MLGSTFSTRGTDPAADAGGQGRRTDDADVSGRPLHACVPDLDPFFRPDSLAVVGAYDAEGRPNTGITRQLATWAVGARLHPVNPGRAGVVLAADTAKFIEVFVRRGLVPDGGGAYLLPRLVGPHRAKELLVLGDDLPAASAERLGPVNRVVPADDLDTAARALAERMAAGPTRTLALTKQLVNASLDWPRRSRT